MNNIYIPYSNVIGDKKYKCGREEGSIRFEKAKVEDAEALTEVQIRTFDDDSRRFGGRPGGGPPGYDSVSWQIEAMEKAIYYKILVEDNIIGGVIISDMGGGHYELSRIFIAPDFQNKGIGTQAIQFIEKAFPAAKRWTLDTPCWAYRNQHFYEKMGYVKVGEAAPDKHRWFSLFLYEKNVTEPCAE